MTSTESTSISRASNRSHWTGHWRRAPNLLSRLLRERQPQGQAQLGREPVDDPSRITRGSGSPIHGYEQTGLMTTRDRCFFSGGVVSAAVAPRHQTGVRRIATWFRAPFSCRALSSPSFTLWCAGNQTTEAVRCAYCGRARWSQLLVRTLRGLTLLPGAHSSTFGTNPLHADSRRSRHGRVGRIGTFGHHQVWWHLQRWVRAAGSRYFSQESELRWSHHVGCVANVQFTASLRLGRHGQGQLVMWVTESSGRQFQQGDQTAEHSSGRTCTARLRRRTLRRILRRPFVT